MNAYNTGHHKKSMTQQEQEPLESESPFAPVTIECTGAKCKNIVNTYQNVYTGTVDCHTCDDCIEEFEND